MSKGNMDLITKEQSDAIERIKAYHAAFEKSFGDQMGYAYLAGNELNRVKETLEHGQFMKWRETNLPEIPHRSATRYMDFAVKMGHVANLTTGGNLKLIGNGDFAEKDRANILAAVHKIADGKTLTQLYRDLGVIREKKAPMHHPRKPKSPSGELEGEDKAAEELANIFLQAAETLCLDEHTISRLKPGKKVEVANAAVKVGQMIRKFSSKSK